MHIMAIKPRPKKPLQSIAKPELRVSVDLQKLFEQALANDADEVTIRISGFNPDLSPGDFQAIVKFSDRTRAWACVVHEKPHIAFVDALTQAAKMPGPTMQERAAAHVKTSKDTAGLLRVSSDSGIKRVKSRLRKGT